MREFEDLELSKWKCAFCGCKNKLHTEILDNSKRFIGYQIKCCACGNRHDFLFNHKLNGKPNKNTPYYYGKETCMQMSRCPHKDCPLYGHSNLKPSKPEKDPNNSKGSCCCCEDNNISIEVLCPERFL